jgi:long-chain fatty acid transport protein
MNLNPNISYRLTDWLSVGGGFSLEYFKLVLSSGIGQSLISPALPDSSYVLNGHSWDWGYNFGIFVTPLEGTRIGLAYRSEIDRGL